jgi:hypothetical protein
MKPTQEQSTKYYKIIKELSEYFGPKDIETMFDVPYQSYYTYADKYDLPKIQESKDMRNKYWKRIRQQAEDNEKRIRLENALKIYGEETKN